MQCFCLHFRFQEIDQIYKQKQSTIFNFRQNCESHSDTENDLNDVPMDCENDSSNHVLENTVKSLDDTTESTKNSPMPFRNMPRGRRRNTNKTGE